MIITVQLKYERDSWDEKKFNERENQDARHSLLSILYIYIFISNLCQYLIEPKFILFKPILSHSSCKKSMIIYDEILLENSPLTGLQNLSKLTYKAFSSDMNLKLFPKIDSMFFQIIRSIGTMKTIYPYQHLLKEHERNDHF